MKKLMTTLGCAFAVLAFAAPALAQNDDVLDEDHVDDPENGKYVFWDEEEMNAFLEKLATEVASEHDGGGMLDSCSLFPPVAFAVSAMHGEGGRSPHWHVVTNIQGSSGSYSVCMDEHIFSYVDALRGTWKAGSSVCDYCDLDDWYARYWNDYDGPWQMDDQQCWIEYQSLNRVYWGEETDELDNEDYDIGDYLVKFDRAGSTTDSTVQIVFCPE